MSGPDEFDWIAALRPLAASAPALGLMDDAAVLPSRPGFDLVISEDAMVEGVHFPEGEACDIVAMRLLRTNLSDLAAKGAEPFGYTLMTAWPASRGWDDREAFIRGLAADGEAFGITPLGGDTVSTPGPLTVSATMLGWVPSGRAVRRSGAKPGHALVVLGVIGDGVLGLKAVRGEVEDPRGELAHAYRLPEPLLHVRASLRTHAAAAADVSDGLIADALHVADASGCQVVIDLERLPLSAAARRWLQRQPDAAEALLLLASGGDDYALACAAPDGDALVREAGEFGGTGGAVAGVFAEGAGVVVRLHGKGLTPRTHGWRHS